MFMRMDTSSHLLFHRNGKVQPPSLGPSSTCCFFFFSTNRPVLLRICRYKSANLSARNYYELLGVERTATTKEIKKAFFTLSKEVLQNKHWRFFIFLSFQYHPDADASDKSLHEKFVKINEAFSVLSKQSTRHNYDQCNGGCPCRERYEWTGLILALNSISRSSYRSPDGSNMHYGNRGASQSHW